MKKLFFLTVLFGGIYSLTACKKDWTCKCSGKIYGTDYKSDTTLADMKSSDAEMTCNKWDYEVDEDNYQDCNLK